MNLARIQKWFENMGKIIVKRRWVFIGLFVLLNIIAGIGLPMLKLDSSVEGWFLEGAEIQQATDRFEDMFGNNDFVGILLETDDVFEPEVLMMIRDLSKELEDKVEFADKVISLTDMEFSRAFDDEIIIDNLIPDEIPQDRDEIEKIRAMALSKTSIKNRIITEDSKQTWILLRLEPFPDDWREKGETEPNSRVGKDVLTILKQDKYQKYDLVASGMSVTAIEEMAYFETEAIKIMLLGLIVAMVLLAVILRSVRGVLIPIVTTISSILIVYGVMGLLRIKLNSIMMTIPVFLGLAVSIGYSIHIFNFFKRKLLLTGERKNSVYYAVMETGWPIFFTAMTTIGSLLSFYFIDLVPIKWLGVTSAFIIIVVYLIVMTLTPALLSFGKDRKRREAEGDTPVTDEIKSDKYFIKFGEWVLKHSVPIVICFIIVMGFFIYGMTKLEINMNIKGSYGDKVPYVQRMIKVSEAVLGAWGSYDITLKFDESDKIKESDVMKRFDALADKILEMENTKRVSSILDVVKDMNQMLNLDDPDYYVIPDNKALIAQLLFLYELSGGTEMNEWVDSDYSVLRLMVEVKDFDANVIESEIDDVKMVINELFPDAQFELSGSVPQFIALNKFVAVGQIKSFFIALIVIMFLLMIVFKSIKTGLIGMIPNITPPVVIAGLLGLTGTPLDAYTVIVLPMILGLAVDDTIHFISHAREEYIKTGSYREGSLITFKTVGKALFMTSFIIVSSFALYMISDAKMLFNLGVFIVAGISSALIADYLITPILVAWTKPFENHGNR